MSQNLLQALLNELFSTEQCGGRTVGITITMPSSTHCSQIVRFSSNGGKETSVNFKPYKPLDEALLHARKYRVAGTFTHES